jgi:hypothetical protein
VGRIPGTFAGTATPGALLPVSMPEGGTIGVVGSDLARYADFTAALCILGKPDDTRLIYTRTVDIVGNCNTICRNYRGEWVWFIGDDHTFDPDVLLRLLALELDVVVPLCLKRSPPYDPVVYGGEDTEGVYYVAELPVSGVAEIYAAGSAGMLVRRHVLEAIADPWFESFGGLNEDLEFCRKVRAAGFSIHCDVDTKLGHIATHQVWPEHREGGWHADIVLDPRLRLPLRRTIDPSLAPA